MNVGPIYCTGTIDSSEYYNMNWLKRMPENAIKVLPQPMGNENQRRWG
jgi:hypothetical protein